MATVLQPLKWGKDSNRRVSRKKHMHVFSHLAFFFVHFFWSNIFLGQFGQFHHVCWCSLQDPVCMWAFLSGPREFSRVKMGKPFSYLYVMWYEALLSWPKNKSLIISTAKKKVQEERKKIKKKKWGNDAKRDRENRRNSRDIQQEWRRGRRKSSPIEIAYGVLETWVISPLECIYMMSLCNQLLSLVPSIRTSLSDSKLGVAIGVEFGGYF